MHKKMKGRQRKAAAIILTAALVLSAGPVPSVLAETEASSETVQQEIPEEESTAPVKPETEVPEETELQTVPLTEQNTETETQVETETETQTEPETETETTVQTETPGETETTEVETEAVTEESTDLEPTETENETEIQVTPPFQIQSVSSVQSNQILQNSDAIDEAVKNVQEQIDILPNIAEFKTMKQEKQQNVYMQAQSVWDAYETLSEEQQVRVDTAKLTELLNYFNGQVETQPSTNAVATLTIGTTTTEYTDISSAFEAAAGKTATIRLLQDAEFSREVLITSGNIIYEGANYTLSSSIYGIMVMGGSLNLRSGNITSALNIYSGGTIEVSGATVGFLGYYGGTVNMSAGAINSIPVGNPSINYIASEITLDQNTFSLIPGGSVTLNAKVSQNTINVERNNIIIPVTWSSSNEAVATVNNGQVTAVSTGTATITASAGGKSATCTVRVKNTTTITNKGGNDGYPTTFINGDSLPVPLMDDFTIDGSNTGFTYQWYAGNQTTGELTGSPIATPEEAGTYTLVVTTNETDTYLGGELRLLVTIEPADYIVTIPSDATAGGGEVSITTNNFKVGEDECV